MLHCMHIETVHSPSGAMQMKEERGESLCMCLRLREWVGGREGERVGE